ncbi:hypothetical protein [Ruthenibacterium lactatiformans]|uniref:hypothetical protein n=1 Tax=Ruthenibacterium lactatiformans TaxID=1550024 RepID=UPI00399FCBD5
MSRPQENREIDITRARPKKGAAPAPQGAQPAPHGAGEHAGQQDAQKQHGTARASSARPGGAKAHAGAGDKQEPGLPERAANGQAGAEPVSRRSPYCWYLRPWQAARTCMWTA